MLKNPYDVLKEFSKTKFERDRKLIEFGYTQTDGFATWIIGFAVAALSLIISNFDSIRKNIGNAYKPIVILLGLTICFGLAFRYFSYFIMTLQKRLEDYFAGVYSDMDMTPIEVDEDVDKTTFDDIIIRLKEDFDVETPYSSPLLEEHKNMELPRLRKHYKDLCEYSKKQFDIAINHWAEVNEIAYKIKKSTSISSFNRQLKRPRIGFKLKIWSWVVGLLYLFCLLSFMSAVIVICIYLVSR